MRGDNWNPQLYDVLIIDACHGLYAKAEKSKHIGSSVREKERKCEGALCGVFVFMRVAMMMMRIEHHQKHQAFGWWLQESIPFMIWVLYGDAAMRTTGVQTHYTHTHLMNIHIHTYACAHCADKSMYVVPLSAPLRFIIYVRSVQIGTHILVIVIWNTIQRRYLPRWRTLSISW